MLFSFLHCFDMIARTLNCFWLIDLMIHILLEEWARCRLSFTALYLQVFSGYSTFLRIPNDETR
jgi:hypothetical protein